MADNTFSTATNLGRLGGSNSRSIKLRGFIGSSDLVDTYKFTVNAGSSFQARSSYEVRGGRFNLSLYVRNPLTDRIQRLTTQSVDAGTGSTRFTVPAIPSSATNLTYYIRLDRPTRNVRYRFEFAPVS